MGYRAIFERERAHLSGVDVVGECPPHVDLVLGYGEFAKRSLLEIRTRSTVTYDHTSTLTCPSARTPPSRETQKRYTSMARDELITACVSASNTFTASSGIFRSTGSTGASLPLRRYV